MKNANVNRKKNRLARHKKTLRKFRQINNGLYRLRITKTNAHIFAQLLDDQNHKVVLSSSSLALKLKNGNISNAALVGADVAKKSLAQKIAKINFDCGGSRYHGRIKALADAARAGGLQF